MRTTIYDVARKAGVSKSLVSLVLNNSHLVREGKRERVLKVIKEMRYRPDFFARGMTMRKSHSIGLIISDVRNIFFPDVIRGVEDVVSVRGYGVFLANTDEKIEKMEQHINNFRGRGVEGLIIHPVRGYFLDCQIIQELKKDGFPFVLIDRYLKKVKTDYVICNNTNATFKAVEYLIKRGYRRIAHICERDCTTTQGRLRGYKTALKKYNIEFDPELVKENKSGLLEEGGYILTRELLQMKKPPRAIFTVNDTIAKGCLKAIEEKDLRVPQDIAVMGYDDLPFASLLNLSTVAPPKYEMGKIAAELLLEKIEGKIKKKRHIILKTELIIRKST